MTPDYIDTVRLLLAIAPTVFASGRFAMKGGTALNLFVQDMPRLSVDIDVVYVDHRPDREVALKSISAELVSMKAARWPPHGRPRAGTLLLKLFSSPLYGRKLQVIPAIVHDQTVQGSNRARKGDVVARPEQPADAQPSR
jgi:hypothetical protein